jgi:peptide-methionine (S)-S-oxide reductase
MSIQNPHKGNSMSKEQITLVAIFISLLLSPLVRAETAIFAGGCFWCVEAAYQDVEGVNDAISGFTGGKLVNPTYNGNHRGHYEAVKVSYDPAIVSYQDLLDIFWVNIDPFDNRGQFCDKGPSYRSAIFVDEGQKQSALDSRAKVMDQFADETVYTEVLDQSTFYPVEEYHQDYYEKNPIRYNLYRTGCRRDARLHQIWDDAAIH